MLLGMLLSYVSGLAAI